MLPLIRTLLSFRVLGRLRSNSSAISEQFEIIVELAASLS